MKNKKYQSLITLWLIFLLFTSKYSLFDYDFLIWYDAGAYVLELKKYINTSNHLSVQNFNQEIATFSLLSAWWAIVNINEPIKIYEFFIILVWGMQVLITYSIFKKKSKREKWSMFLLMIIFIFSIISINHLYLFIFRQYLTSVLLLWLILILLLKNIQQTRKNLLIWYFLWVIIFFHKWTASLALPIILSYLLTQKKWDKQIIKSGLTIGTIALMVYLPYLITFKALLIHTIKDFFIFSVENTGGTYVKAQWVSLITGTNSGAFKESFLKKMFFDNALVGMVCILFIASFKVTTNLRKEKFILITLMILIFLFFIGSNFSQRSTYLIIFLICTTLLYNWINNSNHLKIILLGTILVINIPIIMKKSPYILYKRDPSVAEFIKKIDNNNSVIIARSGNNVIPGQLWYLTWEYWKTFDHKLLKMEWWEEIYKNLTQNVLSNWHSNKIFFPKSFKGKKIYILIGKNNDNFSFNSSNKIESKKWDNSQFAEKVMETKYGSQLNNVYIYKTSEDSFIGNQEN